MSKGLRDIHEAILSVLKQWGEGHSFTLSDLQAALPDEFANQAELPRRLRELRSFGGLKVPAKGKMYKIVSLTPSAKKANPDPISGRLAAEIRLAAHGRCQMCGKTIKDDEIKLVIDHRVPREWGGSSEDPDNLWAICEPCNISKRDFFSTLPKSVMEKCMSEELAIVRLGELLKALEGQVVPRKLLEIVGMDDEWTRRLRELRDLGWAVQSVQDRAQSGKNRFAYTLIRAQPWPKDIPTAIREAAAKRGSKSL